MRNRALRAAVLALILSLAVSAVGSQERDPVKIGLIFTNTGPLAQLGIDMRDGNLLYWSQVGGRAGARRVELLTESTGSNKPDEGLTKARKLVERDHVQILTGVLETPVAYALAPYVNDRKIPLMINIAGADGLSQKQRSEYVFRSSFSNSQASHPLGEWAYRQGYRKMVLLASDFAAGHEHIGGVARTFVAAGGQIIQEIYPLLGASDFAPYLAQIRRDADVVAVAIFGADALRVVAQYAEFGLKGKIPLIGKGGLTDESFLDKMGDAALGIVVAFNWSAALETPDNRRFRDAFESKYRRPASLTAEAGYVREHQGQRREPRRVPGCAPRGRGRRAPGKGEARRFPQPAPDRLHPQDRAKGQHAAQHPDRDLPEHEPVLDLDSRGIHGHAVLCRAEGQMDQVTASLSTMARWAIVRP